MYCRSRLEFWDSLPLWYGARTPAMGMGQKCGGMKISSIGNYLVRKVFWVHLCHFDLCSLSSRAWTSAKEPVLLDCRIFSIFRGKGTWITNINPVLVGTLILNKKEVSTVFKVHTTDHLKTEQEVGSTKMNMMIKATFLWHLNYQSADPTCILQFV